MIAQAAPTWTSPPTSPAVASTAQSAGTPRRTPCTGSLAGEQPRPHQHRRRESDHEHQPQQERQGRGQRREPQLALDRPGIRPQRHRVLDGGERERPARGHRDRAADVGSVATAHRSWWYHDRGPRARSHPPRLAHRDRGRLPLPVSVFPADPQRERAAPGLPGQGHRRGPHVLDRSRRRALRLDQRPLEVGRPLLPEQGAGELAAGRAGVRGGAAGRRRAEPRGDDVAVPDRRRRDPGAAVSVADVRVPRALHTRARGAPARARRVRARLDGDDVRAALLLAPAVGGVHRRRVDPRRRQQAPARRRPARRSRRARRLPDRVRDRCRSAST